MRIHTLTLKGGEKRGQPKFGSLSWEVTLTGDLEPGETVGDAAKALKAEVKQALGLAWGDVVASTPREVTARVMQDEGSKRMTGTQRGELQALMELAGQHGVGLTAKLPVTQDEAAATIKDLRGRLFDKGRVRLL